MKNKSSYMGRQKRYTEAQLENSLDMIENGYSHSETLTNAPLNKSIIAREMRKRKNLKGRQAGEIYDKYYSEETIKLFEKYVEKINELNEVDMN